MYNYNLFVKFGTAIARRLKWCRALLCSATVAVEFNCRAELNANCRTEYIVSNVVLSGP